MFLSLIDLIRYNGLFRLVYNLFYLATMGHIVFLNKKIKLKRVILFLLPCVFPEGVDPSLADLC